MPDGYYQKRGWDAEGRLPAARQEEIAASGALLA